MSDTQATTTKSRVLIVEDDLDIANVYTLKFEKEGYEVRVAEDGEVGIAQAATWKPDIILLDIMLPKKDGFEVLQAVRADDKTKDTPVIMWTNLSETEEARKAREYGANEYLVKVFNMPAEIVNKVTALLASKE